MKVSKWLGISGLAMLVFLFGSSTVPAEQMEKSGKSTLHSAYKGVGNVTAVAENRLHWGGIYWGHSFNDSGSGFLHNVVWNCPAASDIANGTVSFKGYCTMTDADGDKTFGDWSGGGPMTGEITGNMKISGGTGRYSGIEGSIDFQCKAVGTDDQLSCTQQVEYELP